MTATAISRLEIIATADSIEPLPAAVTRLLRVLTDDDFDTNVVVEIMSQDPALAGDVLAAANSAASGASRRIGDMREAVSRIGVREIVNLALRRAMRGRFAVPAACYGLGPDDLWRHSLSASIAADVIRRVATRPVAPMISTAALIHDVGKLVVAQCLPDGVAGQLLDHVDDGTPLDVAERDLLGLDHGEVSAVVARTWGLPVSVQAALTQHHLDAGTEVFNQALVLANRLAHAIEEFDVTEDEPASVLRNVDVVTQLEVCGIEPGAVPNLVIEVADSVTATLAAYEI